ncbi:MAG: phosphoribosylformylglycinamidine synthase subunit PurQ [Spirochaetia bacterium]|nr:phosphoribosylformylglycinamidine synthase subunit PurQ [Spirochaetia bacterium]
MGVITFPGSNCDHDIVRVLTDFFHAQTSLLWHANVIRETYNLLVVPGGFSYGDYLRAGAIARFAPAMSSLQEHVRLGRPVLGICNGFQILCEAGLLPGALIRNENLKHICRTVEIKPHSSNSFTKHLKKDSYKIPISHSDGNYRISEDGLKELQDNNQIVFRYTENPNGSVFDIAGIINKKNKVLGMMPHPERVVDPLNGGTDGFEIISSVLSL